MLYHKRSLGSVFLARGYIMVPVASRMHGFQLLWIASVFATALGGGQPGIGDTRKFKRVNAQDAWMKPLPGNSKLEAASLSECAAKCKRRSDECFSFVFKEKKSKSKSKSECHLGSWSAHEKTNLELDCITNLSPKRKFDKIDGNLYSSACCAGEYQLRTNNAVSKCVRHVTEKKKFEDAQKECQEDGGHLITFKTKVELDFVRKLTKCLRDNTWLGIRDNCKDKGIKCKDKGSRKFFWIDKEELSRDVLKEIQLSKYIDNTKGEEGCILVGSDDFQEEFNDFECDTEFAFVCERNPIQTEFHCA